MSGVTAKDMNSAPSPYARQADWQTLVLGIGNVLYADEGFGVRCVEALHRDYVFPDDVCVMDGGTQGIFLLPWVRSAEKLLIFDAIDFGLPANTLRLIVGDEVPRYMGAKKISMHQAGFQEVLSSAMLSGDFPDEIALVGVQPLVLTDYGGSLTTGVKAKIAPAVELALEVLQSWGVKPEPRLQPLTGNDIIGPAALAMSDYERGRPKLGGGTR